MKKTITERIISLRPFGKFKTHGKNRERLAEVETVIDLKDGNQTGKPKRPKTS